MQYRRPPKIGAFVLTSHGSGIVTNIIGFDEVVQDMTSCGVPLEAIERLRLRVVHFLRTTQRYYECEIRSDDGSFRTDWSDWQLL